MFFNYSRWPIVRCLIDSWASWRPFRTFALATSFCIKSEDVVRMTAGRQEFIDSVSFSSASRKPHEIILFLFILFYRLPCMSFCSYVRFRAFKRKSKCKKGENDGEREREKTTMPTKTERLVWFFFSLLDKVASQADYTQSSFQYYAVAGAVIYNNATVETIGTRIAFWRGRTSKLTARIIILILLHLFWWPHIWGKFCRLIRNSWKSRHTIDNWIEINGNERFLIPRRGTHHRV